MKFRKLNSDTWIGDDNKTVKVIVDGITYKSCSICDSFFPITGRNTKYCLDCRKKVNIIKTADRHKYKRVG